MNKRKHTRTLIHQHAQSGIIRRRFPEMTPRLELKPVISNISYGGMGLLFAPEINPHTLAQLEHDKNRIYVEFYLPPSVRKIGVSGTVRWTCRKRHLDVPFLRIGIEFQTRTQELYREISRFHDNPARHSELYKNRRFFPRIPADCSAHFTISGIKKLGVLPRSFAGRIDNISATGAGLLVGAFNEKEFRIIRSGAAVLNLKFTLPGTANRLTLHARPVHIRRQRSSSASSGIHLGLKFVRMRERDLSLLFEYVCIKRVSLLKEEILPQDA